MRIENSRITIGTRDSRAWVLTPSEVDITPEAWLKRSLKGKQSGGYTLGPPAEIFRHSVVDLKKLISKNENILMKINN